MSAELTDPQLLRYSRQILLDNVDIGGQQALLAATVLVVGLGGLGCPVALYLAAAGVGRLVLVDFDQVELANLQRQILFSEADIGTAKATAARARLGRLNSATEIQAINARLTGKALLTAVQSADVVVDCTDNAAVRCELNRACMTAAKPLVSAAAIRWEGQVTVFDFRCSDSACYQCLYPQSVDGGEGCNESGVIAPLVGIIGAAQALEVVKLVCATGSSLAGRLLLFDGLAMEWQELSLPRRPGCEACAGRS